MPLKLSVAAVVILASLSAGNVAIAADCSVDVLHGRYVFTHRGFLDPGAPTVKRIHYGVITFDGGSKFFGKQSSSRGGRIGRENIAGSYTVEADCSGTITMTTGAHKPTHWDIYLTEDHRRGHMIRMDEGSMAVRSFEK
ncbi:MAG: hypothetical protein AB7O60_12020 [Variibacter sp.]